MDEARIIELYILYRERRRLLNASAEFAEAAQLGGGHWLPMHSRDEFLAVAQRDLRDLANFVNEFTFHMNALSAWASLAPSLDTSELGQIVIEFIHPVAYFCLGAPYALKCRLFSSAALVSHLANEFIVAEWEYDPKINNYSSLDRAKKHASTWRSWPVVEKQLEQLNDDSFLRSTRGFRKQFQHGSPPEVMLGDKWFIRRDKIGGIVFGVTPPLGLDKAVAALAPQQGAAVAAFRAYSSLVEEQVQAVTQSTAQCTSS